MLGRYDLQEYYKENFMLKKHGGFSLQEIEEMIVFERDIYFAQLIQYLKEEQKELKNGNG